MPGCLGWQFRDCRFLIFKHFCPVRLLLQRSGLFLRGCPRRQFRTYILLFVTPDARYRFCCDHRVFFCGDAPAGSFAPTFYFSLHLTPGIASAAIIGSFFVGMPTSPVIARLAQQAAAISTISTSPVIASQCAHWRGNPVIMGRRGVGPYIYKKHPRGCFPFLEQGTSSRYAFPLRGNSCSHQCLHWWQELSGGQFLCYGFDSLSSKKRTRPPIGGLVLLEQGTGVEPAFTAWEAVVLPIYEPCVVSIISNHSVKCKRILSTPCTCSSPVLQ